MIEAIGLLFIVIAIVNVLRAIETHNRWKKHQKRMDDFYDRFNKL